MLPRSASGSCGCAWRARSLSLLEFERSSIGRAPLEVKRTRAAAACAVPRTSYPEPRTRTPRRLLGAHALQRVDARCPRAGMRHAAPTTTSSPTTTDAYVDTSSAVTPNNSPRQQPAAGERADDAERETDHRPPQPLTHDEHQHVPRRRAERETNAEFARARRDHVREHAVDADRREQQRDRGEARCERECEAPRREARRRRRRRAS